MTTAPDPGDLRRLRANFAQALVEHDHLHEALGQFEAALEEAGEVPTTREIERHVQRINRRLLQDRLDGHLDRALASPDQAADALAKARVLLAEQPSAKSTRLRDASWIEKANAALVEPRAHQAFAMLLGDSTLRAGRFDEAHWWYQQAVDVEPAPEAILGAAEAAYLAGQIDAAARYLEELTDASPPARVLRAQVLHAQGDHEKAADLTDELLTEGPDEPSVRLLRGSIALALAQPDAAQQAAESLLDRDPSHSGALGSPHAGPLRPTRLARGDGGGGQGVQDRPHGLRHARHPLPDAPRARGRSSGVDRADGGRSRPCRHRGPRGTGVDRGGHGPDRGAGRLDVVR